MFLRSHDILIYRLCDAFTELIVCLMICFSPWAFGTTQPWAIWTMNVAGYCLGGLLVVKLSIRWLKHYQPPRWGHPPPPEGPADRRVSPGSPSGLRGLFSGPALARTLALLTALILAYCLVSALNARATYQWRETRLDYHDSISWLPASLDSGSTWFCLWNYLALALAFWSVHDWLVGQSLAEEQAAHARASAAVRPGFFVPARLQRLLWVLCLNGGLLAVESILQRVSGTGRLLWLVEPAIHKTAETQLGPFAYRSNGAQYFNLLWPVCLGFWWTLHRSGGSRKHFHHLLLLCALVMAACPIMSISRAGALVAVGLMVSAACFLPAAHYLLPGSRTAAHPDSAPSPPTAPRAHRAAPKPRRPGTALALLLFVAGALALGLGLGWKSLKPRLYEFESGLQDRFKGTEHGARMARDYPVFGTGPGTFGALNQLYRTSPDEWWPGQLHDDWMETRLTFGWAGSGLIALAFLTVLARWFAPGGMFVGRRFVILLWLAMAGCLLHAKVDFPFQIYSILFLFLVLCAILFALSRRPFHAA